jgi:hypothetical protein
MSARELPSSPFNKNRVPVEAKVFELNERVSHDSHGMGTVTNVEPAIAVTVNFGSHQRRIVSPFTKLSKL